MVQTYDVHARAQQTYAVYTHTYMQHQCSNQMHRSVANSPTRNSATLVQPQVHGAE